jgi:hypothetical protein
MGLFISKYELRKLFLEENELTDRDIKLSYMSKQICDITKIYGTKILYVFLY